jgi:hypothetical protein
MLYDRVHRGMILNSDKTTASQNLSGIELSLVDGLLCFILKLRPNYHVWMDRDLPPC